MVCEQLQRLKYWGLMTFHPFEELKVKTNSVKHYLTRNTPVLIFQIFPHITRICKIVLSAFACLHAYRALQANLTQGGRAGKGEEGWMFPIGA